MKKFLLLSFLFLCQSNESISTNTSVKVEKEVTVEDSKKLENIVKKNKFFSELSPQVQKNIKRLIAEYAMQFSIEEQHRIIQEIKKIEEIREKMDRKTFLKTTYKILINLTSPTTIGWVALTLSILFIKNTVTSGEVSEILNNFKDVLNEYLKIRGIDLGEKGITAGTLLLCKIFGGC